MPLGLRITPVAAGVALGIVGVGRDVPLGVGRRGHLAELVVGVERDDRLLGRPLDGRLVRAGQEGDGGVLLADQVAGDLVGEAVAVDVAQAHRDAGGEPASAPAAAVDADLGSPEGREVRSLLVVVGVGGRVAGRPTGVPPFCGT